MNVAASIILALLPQQGPTAKVAPWYSVRLKNGVTVNACQVKTATKFTAFSMLPIGLCHDDAGRAQFSHLLEHMMIRSTDPKRLRIGKLMLNGETTNQVLRLESIGPANRWKESLLRHPRWLTARIFDPATLAREKVRIESEERGTVPQGYNHKWATAAWSQLMRGHTDANVHGDVNAATVEQIQEYAHSKVKLSSAQIFAIGPQDPKEVIEALRTAFQKIPPGKSVTAQPATSQSATSQPASKPATQIKPLAPGHHKATWDLKSSHYLEWYALGKDCSPVQAQVLSQAITMALFRVAEFRTIPGRVLAGVVDDGEQPYLLISCNLPKNMTAKAIQGHIGKSLASARRFAGQMPGASFAAMFDRKPDFEAQRKRVANERVRDLIEANWAMQCGYAALRLGIEIDKIAAAYQQVSAKDLAALVQKCCTKARRTSAELAYRK